MLAAGLAIALASAFFLHGHFFNDDALITIRYSENLAAGHGLVYNPGERVLGTTTPFWALLLSLLAYVGLTLPTTATVLGILGFGWTAAVSVLLQRQRGATLVTQLAAAALVGTSPLLVRWAGSGMETSFYVASIASFLWLFQAERFRALGVVGGVMLLLRPDAGVFLFAGCVLGCWSARSMKPVLRVLPGFLIVTLPWFIGATLYYGSPLPNSGFAKRLQVADWGPFLTNFGRHVMPALALVPFALIGGAQRLRSPRAALPVAGLVLFVFGMHFGSLPGCAWYMPPAMFLVVLLAAEGAGSAAMALARDTSWTRSLASWAVLVGAALGHQHLPKSAQQAKRDQAGIERLHGAIGHKLKEIAPAGSSVAVDNIGYIGYRSGLRVVDIMGLVSPGIVEHLAAGDETYAIRTRRPEFLAIWVGRGATPRYTPDQAWLDENGYRPVFAIPVSPGATAAYTIFSRLD